MAKAADVYGIGLVGADAALLEACAGALAGLGALVSMDRHELASLARAPSVELLLLSLSGPTREAVAFFVEVRGRFPALPVIVLAPGVDANFAVELVKCGASDLLLVPLDQGALRAKVERALFGRTGPTFGWPSLDPLRAPDSTPHVSANRRHCYRAPVRSFHPALATVRVADGRGVSLVVEDFSVEAEDSPGGMQLLVREDAVKLVPLDDWKRGAPVSLLLHLADGDPPIPVIARIAGPVRPGPRRSRRMGVRYEATNRGDVARLERFWVACQQMAKD